MSVELWRTRPYTQFPPHLVERLYEQAFSPFVNGSRSDGGSTEFQSLPVNVWQTDDAYLATLMAPGLDEQTITVTVHQDTVLIEGALATQVPDGATAVWQEFSLGPARFRRSLRLGTAVDPSKVEALYRSGLLMITMPKAEQSKPRQIQVKGMSSEAKVS